MTSAAILQQTLSRIHPLDAEALGAARARQNRLSKPAGSLGTVEDIGIQLSGISGQVPPPVPKRSLVAVFAGDHGVVAQGVSAHPSEITIQMVLNMAAGGAAVNVLARQHGATVWVTDVGVAGALPTGTGIRNRRVAPGTADFSRGPAMTQQQTLDALRVGIETAEEAVEQGADVLLMGEMGIGNTTPATALISVFTGVGPHEVTGIGAGADAATVAHKSQVISDALALHRPDPAEPLEVLAKVGGFEHAALTGLILGAAAARVPVILDGVIACSAALVAAAIAPETTGFLIAGHAGAEPGILTALDELGLTPLVDLDLRLGEGSGALLALPTVQGAARILGEMATFADAAVNDVNTP